MLCLAALAALTQAQAIGLGPVPGTVALGQPLDMTIAVQLGATESITSQCVHAQVLMGDSPLAPGVVRTRLETRSEGSATRTFIRLTTSTVVTEPLVTINLSLGCPASFTRQIVAFADPPELMAARAAAAAPLQVTAPVLASTPAPASATAAVSQAAPAVAPAGAEVQVRAAGVPKKARQVAKATAEVDPAKAKVQPRTQAKAVTPPQDRSVKARATPVLARAEAAAAATPTAKPTTPSAKAPERESTGARPRLSASIIAASVDLSPRLQLDTYERATATPAAVATTDRSLAKVEASAAAALAASDAMGNLQAQRMEILERDLKRARAEAASSRTVNAKLRTRLGEAEATSQWTLVLGSLAALGLGVAGWLGWRLRRVERDRKQAWWNSQEAEAAQAAAAAERAVGEPDYGLAEPRADASDSTSQALSDARTAAQVAAQVAVLAADQARHAPVDPFGAEGEAADADDELDAGASSVNIESLIDIEQQVEFFVVLGQEDSAIELLVNFLKTHGADAPLVHLRLLEAYHRKGDAEAYEKARARMARLFGGQAPAWSTEWSQGRSLEEYPEVMARVNDVWSIPWQAMSELEGVMFNAKGQPPMDLAAYRDALVLYSTLRDKQENPEGEAPTAPAPAAATLPAVAAAATELPALDITTPMPVMPRTGGSAELEPAVDHALDWIATEMGSIANNTASTEPPRSALHGGEPSMGTLSLDLPRIDLGASPVPAQVAPIATSSEGLMLDLDLSELQPMKARGTTSELTLVDPSS